jgi:hypothetical protein
VLAGYLRSLTCCENFRVDFVYFFTQHFQYFERVNFVHCLSSW